MSSRATIWFWPSEVGHSWCVNSTVNTWFWPSLDQNHMVALLLTHQLCTTSGDVRVKIWFSFGDWSEYMSLFWHVMFDGIFDAMSQHASSSSPLGAFPRRRGGNSNSTGCLVICVPRKPNNWTLRFQKLSINGNPTWKFWDVVNMCSNRFLICLSERKNVAECLKAALAN